MRNPISPRAGTRYSMRTQPVPWLTICSIRPLRSASSWVTTPTYSSGMSIAHPLHRLVHGAVDLPRDHLRLADRQLEALAAHHLDEHRELQLAAPLNLPHVGALGLDDAQRDVAHELGSSRPLQLAGGQLVAVLPGQRRGVDADGHRQRRLVDGDHRQRPRVIRVGERLADRDLRDPGDRDDLARSGLRQHRRGRAPR